MSNARKLADLVPDGLDIYEEGSWNPTFGYTGGSTGVVSSSVGRYSKIGDVIFLWGNINLTNKGSDTGNVIIGGFPFTIINVSMKFTGAIGAGRINTSQSTYYIIEGIQNSTTADLMAYYSNTSGNKFNVTNSHVSNTTFLHFQITYKTV